jgi:hypothetical protein
MAGRVRMEEEMSAIGDELREWIDDEDLYATQIADLRRIADRIDSEMVELPLSADGRPIRPGDAVYHKDGSEFLVAVMRLTDCGWMLLRPGDRVYYSPSDLYHERPDALALIADDLDELREDFRMADGDTFFTLSDIVDRIRALAGKEDTR